MIRMVLLTAIALAIAVGGGAWSVWVALNAGFGVGAVQVGEWSAFPAVGTPDADPYSKARFAREGGLVLGKAEGISFVAQHDSLGAALRRGCSYTIEGEIPSARFWTLYAADPNRVVLPDVGRRRPVLHSLGLLRNPQGTFVGVGRPPPRPRQLAGGRRQRADALRAHALRHAARQRPRHRHEPAPHPPDGVQCLSSSTRC